MVDGAACEPNVGRSPRSQNLEKLVVILAHLYELHRHAEPRVCQAFTAAAYKAAAAAVASNGSWELSWELVGIADPDKKSAPLMTAAEQVAIVAMAKEKKVLEEALAKSAKTKTKDDP